MYLNKYKSFVFSVLVVLDNIHYLPIRNPQYFFYNYTLHRSIIPNLLQNRLYLKDYKYILPKHHMANNLVLRNQPLSLNHFAFHHYMLDTVDNSILHSLHRFHLHFEYHHDNPGMDHIKGLRNRRLFHPHSGYHHKASRDGKISK